MPGNADGATFVFFFFFVAGIVGVAASADRWARYDPDNNNRAKQPRDVASDHPDHFHDLPDSHYFHLLGEAASPRTQRIAGNAGTRRERPPFARKPTMKASPQERRCDAPGSLAPTMLIPRIGCEG
jgi:hypothetical protein